MHARRTILLGLLGTGLSACGFRPLLYSADGEDIRERLAAIEITGLNGRVGQQLRTALEDNLNPTSLAVPVDYVLAIRLQSRTSALAVQLDNTITRYNLALIANFQLLDASDRKEVYRSSVRRVSSYNVRRAPFATLTAEVDAERRAAEEISDDIRTLLAVHFQRRAPAA